MQNPVPKLTKRKVIALWLRGYSSRKIADATGVATGTVSNIKNDYLAQLGSEDVDEVRWLIQEMKRAGIIANQCAAGARMMNILAKLNIDVDDVNFTSYLSGLYQACQNKLLPDELALALVELFAISQNAADQNLRLDQIPSFIKQKLAEKESLEHELKSLNEQKVAAENQLQDFLKKARTTEAKLENFISVKEQLKKYRLVIQDINALANALGNAKRLDYDVEKIVALISKIESLETTEKDLTDKVSALNDNVSSQNEQIEQLLQEINELTEKRDTLKNDIISLSQQVNDLKSIINKADPKKIAGAAISLCVNIENVKLCLLDINTIIPETYKAEGLLFVEPRFSKEDDTLRNLMWRLQEIFDSDEIDDTEIARILDHIASVLDRVSGQLTPYQSEQHIPQVQEIIRLTLDSITKLKETLGIREH